MSDQKSTFWDHLDALRASVFRVVIITLLFGIIAFFFKDILFQIVLAPKQDSFVTYELFRSVMARFSSGMALEHFSVDLINTGLAEQFLIHIKVALCAGFLCASPYILYALFRFVSPALYANERKYAFRVVFSGYTMFLLGVLLNYFLIFPLTFRFLGTYQVSAEVANLITLRSYISTLMMLNIMMGIVFEMPVVAWLFAKLGFLSSAFMKKYRRHAIVIIVAVAAVITPTADIFTLLLVSVPMYLLYEISIMVVSRAN
ncbi:MAG: twin-arginine translocase subunit TatC [Bacteroidales bacterium]|jgi:sec-independent protein translocase protein TatC|nr:twin-arginine translocase subunit TatC [Bacteroidales bacterium]